MTREEAIKRLMEYEAYAYGIWHNEEKDTKAFDMAIEALSAEAVDVAHDIPEYCRWSQTYTNMVQSAVSNVSADRPTNTPTDHDKEWIIGCIKHDGFIHTHRFDKANQIILEALEPKGGDLISRADALNTIKEFYSEMGVDTSVGIWNGQLVEIIKEEDEDFTRLNLKWLWNRFETLPSAEATGALDDAIAKYVAAGYMLPPEDRPKGEFEICGNSNGLNGTMYYKCSLCGTPIDPCDKFCRGCGAYMKGSTE